MAKKTYWNPVRNRGYGTYYVCWGTPYQAKEAGIPWRSFESGTARQEFIREQSELIKKFATDEEYVAFYKMVLTITA